MTALILRRRCRFVCTAWLVCLFLFAGCSMRDGPFRPVSGAEISRDQLKQIEVKHLTMAEVRAAVGAPTRVSSLTNQTEQWIFESLARRTSVDRVFLAKTVSCQFMRTTDTVTFEAGRVSKTARGSELWTTASSDQRCTE